MIKKKIFTLTIMHLLFFSGIQVLFSYELVPSVELRNHVVDELLRGILLNGMPKRFYTQKNGKTFAIEVNSEKQEIHLIPESYGRFDKHSRSSWVIRLDENQDIKDIKIYVLNDQDSFVLFKPTGFTCSISITIKNYSVLRDVLIPISIKKVLLASFDDIMRNTRKILPWDWLFPLKKNFESYAENQNFAAFINQKYKIKGLDDYSYYSYTNKVTQWYAYSLIDFTNLLLEFSDNTPVSFLQFLPLMGNRQKLPISHPEFLYQYTSNLITYLNRFAMYSAKLESNIPPHISFSNTIDILESQLYLWSVRYPSYFFLVLLDELRSKEGTIEKKSVALRIYVPYFTPNGDFDFYQTGFSDMESQVLDTEQSELQYSYRIFPLGAPFSYDTKY